MSANVLETTGDNATFQYGSIGTLTGGTLSGLGTLTGAYSGTVLAVGTMTAFGKIYDITPNQISVTEVETTKLASTAKESQPGTPDHGEVTVTLAYSSANVSTIASWIANRNVMFFEATVDDYTVADTANAFLGWVKEFTPLSGEIKKDETLKAKLTVKITGVPLLVGGN